ncbi:MAG TPA: response regulator [Candidatus Nitrosotalea sp.]|nr:response regulator [Candidatus Nitrosotalea sp.]
MSQSASAEAVPTPGALILFADDEGTIRKMVGAYLRRRGYEVALVEDGEQAWAAIQRRRPQLLITDINMPRLDGLGLIARLRAHPDTSLLPVIILTATLSAAEVARSGWGGTGLLVKPVELAALASAVARALAPPTGEMISPVGG